jgi:hypothetical protein
MKTINSVFAIALCAILGSLAAGCGAKLNENTEKQLKSALEAQHDAFKACYEKALERDRNAQGPMNLELDINKTPGAVTKAKVGVSTIQDAEMKKCVVKVVKEIKLPEPPNVPVEGHYSLIFGFEK